MATRASHAASTQIEAAGAGREAARRACEGIGGPAEFCLVFATSGYDQQEVLRGVSEGAGTNCLAGCSGEGVIVGDSSDERDRVVGVLAIRSDRLRFDSFLADGYPDDPAGCGRAIGNWIANERGDDALGLLLFPDGLVGNCTTLLDALSEGLSAPLPIVGGTAGDAMLFERTWQYAGTRAASGAVSAVLVRGQGSMEIAVSHGCMPIGAPHRVTRSEGGWLHEIDGRPAWSVFKEFLDGDPEDLNAEGIVHLCIGEELPAEARRGYDEFIIRTPLQLDNSTGALFFPGGGLCNGAPIRLTRRDQARIRSGASECGRAIASRAGQPPTFVLQVDCAGRGRVLFGSCAGEQIVGPVRQAVGPAVPWIGFHSYGEIAPLAGRPYYHNYTVALCAFFET